jgi:hypothetical protein
MSTGRLFHPCILSSFHPVVFLVDFVFKIAVVHPAGLKSRVMDFDIHTDRLSLDSPLVSSKHSSIHPSFMSWLVPHLAKPIGIALSLITSPGGQASYYARNISSSTSPAANSPFNFKNKRQAHLPGIGLFSSEIDSQSVIEQFSDGCREIWRI